MSTTIDLDPFGDERDALTREAMADVVAGRVVHHEVVLEWLLSIDPRAEQLPVRALKNSRHWQP